MRKRRTNWKSLGFLKNPPNENVARAALDARRYFERMPCYHEFRSALLRKDRNPSICQMIQSFGQGLDVSGKTLILYVRLFRKFFFHPLGVLGETIDTASLVVSPGPLPGDIQTVVDVFRNKLNEIAELDKLAALQVARVQEARALEIKFELPLPNLTRDIAAAAGILNDLVRLKGELGIPGYVPIPKRVDMRHSEGESEEPIDNLSPDDKKLVLEFADLVRDMLEQAKNNNSDVPLSEEELARIFNRGKTVDAEIVEEKQ